MARRVLSAHLDSKSSSDHLEQSCFEASEEPLLVHHGCCESGSKAPSLGAGGECNSHGGAIERL